MDAITSSVVDTNSLHEQPQSRAVAESALLAAAQALRNIAENKNQDPYGQILSQQKDYLVPHQFTYASVWNWYQKYYYNYFDESLINSQQNSLAMWRDGLTCELHWHRTLPTMSLPSTVEVDDEDDQDQVKIKKQAQQIIDRLPYFQNLKQQLLQAIFFGKSGSQFLYHHKKIAGKDRFTVRSHIPIQGDKIVYGWSEGNDEIPGVFVYRTSPMFKDPEMKKHLRFLDKGPAFFLENPYHRDQFIIHNFNPTDSDYLFESEKALMIHGRGMRDALYWTWNMRAELLGWDLNALQRVGANGMLYAFFQSGDDASKNAVLDALMSLIQYNVAAFPKNFGDGSGDIIQRIDPSQVGYDVLYQLITHLEEIMRRCYLGQNLSSQSAPTGLGSGVADLQAGTFQNIVLFDAGCLSECIDDQLFQNIIKYNLWEYHGKVYRGSDLPFSMRYKIQVERENVKELIDAAATLIQMGVPLDVEDLRDKAGFVAPKTKATTVAMPGGQSGGVDNQHVLTSEHKSAPGSGGQSQSRPDTPLSPSSSLPAKRATQPEQFAANETTGYYNFTPSERIGYELANMGGDLALGGWYHSSTRRAWVSISPHTPIDKIRQLGNALEQIVGPDKWKIVVETPPSGPGWQKVSTDEFIIEPEWFSKENCGTGAGGFQSGNTCAKTRSNEENRSRLKDFSGWLSPEGKLLIHAGSHGKTLRDYGVNVSPNRALNEGYTWMNQSGSTLYVEVHHSRVSKVKSSLEDLLNENVKSVIIEVFGDSGKKTKEFNFSFKNGFLHDDLEKFAKDRGEDPGVMIALTLHPDLARQLALKDGEDPSDFHITLAYLGRVSSIGQEAVEMVHKVCELLALNSEPLRGSVGGVGRFPASDSSDGKDVVYAGVDVPRLTDFRAELTHVLGLAKVPYKANHGFTPHITLKYIDKQEDMPVSRIGSFPAEFLSLDLYVGDEVTSYSFSEYSGPGRENFEPNPCGDTKGGFQPHNTCAKSGGDSRKNPPKLDPQHPSFNEEDESVFALEEKSEAWFNDLGKDEKHAIREYIHSMDYKEVGKRFRSGDTTKEDIALVDAIKSAPITDKIAWRGLDSEFGGTRNELKDKMRNSIGQVLEWKAPTSASLSERIAGTFGDVLFKIVSNNGRYINQASPTLYKEEKEVMFLPGSKFKVTDVREDVVFDNDMFGSKNFVVLLKDVTDE